MTYRLFNLKKPPLFRPKFTRGDQSLVIADSPNNLKIKGVIGNSNSTSSFRYAPDKNIKSTQQLNIDYSFFENHTFFDSAVSKTNIAFDKIINSYPFDGTLREVEDFEDKLTGFESFLLKTFPKNTGYIVLSGTVKDEDPLNGFAPGLGQYLTVRDGKGLRYPQFSREKNAQPVLDPGENSFTLEMFLFIPEEVNDNQVIVQKRSSLSRHMTLALSSSTRNSISGLSFGITSGSDYLYLTSSLTKGRFSHIAAQYDREGSEQKLKLFIDGDLYTTSSGQYEMGDLNFSNADLIIGSGSDVRMNDEIFKMKETLSGGIDEFRYFHSARSQKSIHDNIYNEIYGTSDLKLYYNFNEVSASYDLNSVCLDSSGNSLHSPVTNFDLRCRTTSSYGLPANPTTAENKERNPILFMSFKPLLNLNTILLNSASYYDEYNPNLITKLVPPHYFIEGLEEAGQINQFTLENLNNTLTQTSLPGSAVSTNAQLLVSLLLVWAKFFDELKLFIDSFGDLRNIDYENHDTIADNFLYSLAEYYNIELPDIFPNADLNQLIEGQDIYSIRSLRSKLTLDYIQNKLWRRLLVNAVYMHKTTGTIDGLKAVLRNLGINIDDIFTIREYGGQTQLNLSGSRVNKTDNMRLLSFTGSLSPAAASYNHHGIPMNKPFLFGSYMSGSRVEVGIPKVQGLMIDKELYPPYGISNNKSDGLFTSGSWTFEGTYRFPLLVTGSYPLEQSLVRFHMTGSATAADRSGLVVTNLVLTSGSVPLLQLFARGSSFIPPGPTPAPPVITLPIYSASLFNGKMWNISFGRGPEFFTDIDNSNLYGSYFLRVGEVGDKRLNNIYYTSSFTHEIIKSKPTSPANVETMWQHSSPAVNASGSFAMVGLQSITLANRCLNDSSLSSIHRTTNFAGEAGLLRFWSEHISLPEWKEHVRNPTSVGVKNPTINYNFLLHNSGTFERMRVNTIGKQATTASNVVGSITLYDFTQNNLNFSGSGFEPLKTVFNANNLIYSTLDPQFDVLGTTEKVRIRSMQNTDKILEGGYPYARQAPVYDVPHAEEVTDDLKFSLEMSLVKALNEDIINLFSDYQFIENALGRTNLLFSEKYPELDQVSKNYFENLTGKLEVDTYYNLFKWFNDTFSSTIERMIPSKTKFLGINFVIESHALERHKFKYLYDEIYLKALDRDPTRGVILLSQFVGNLKKF